MDIHTDPTMIDLQLDRIETVLEQRGDRRSSLYADIQKGIWTSPIHLGRASTWPRHETQELLAARIAGATPDQMKQLVCDLMARRTAMMPRIPSPERATA